MSLTRDLTRPLTRSLTGDLTDRNQFETCRYLTTMDAASGKNYTIPSITLTNADFLLEFKYQAPSAPSGNQSLFAGPLSAPWAGINATTGASRIKYGGTTLIGSVDICDGDEHLVWHLRLAGTQYIYVDRVPDNSVATTSDAFEITAIGDLPVAGGFESDGKISDIRIYGSGVLQRNYKVDQNWGSSQLFDYSVNAQHGEAVSIVAADAERFCKNTETTPNQWENADKSTIIPIAY